MAYSAWDITKLVWQILTQLVSLAVFALVVFLLPQGRTEQLVVTLAAGLWWLITDRAAAAWFQEFKNRQSLMALLRCILPHIKDEYSKEAWDADRAFIEENVPMDDVSYAKRHAPNFNRNLRLSDLRLTVEETWYECVPAFRHSARNMAIFSSFQLVKGSLLAWSVFTLVRA